MFNKLFVFVLILPFSALSQNVPIIVTPLEPILDQFGVPLSRENGGDYVQILFFNGQIFPPDTNGDSHSNNPIAYTTFIGAGTIAHSSTVGRFSAAITKRSEDPIFTRAWNTPLSSKMSYYSDSQVFTPNQGEVFYPVFSNMIPVCATDSDFDGLNDSMEIDLGSDRFLIDTDGDGFGDYHEFRAGTILTNAESFLFINGIFVDGNTVNIDWASVSGKSYRLQYTERSLNDPLALFTNQSFVITATQDFSQIFITNTFNKQLESFRILLVE